ncbi:hypothetical protein V8C86DRAFT_3023789 [Haematococcus lacustris]
MSCAQRLPEHAADALLYQLVHAGPFLARHLELFQPTVSALVVQGGTAVVTVDGALLAYASGIRWAVCIAGGAHAVCVTASSQAVLASSPGVPPAGTGLTGDLALHRLSPALTHLDLGGLHCVDDLACSQLAALTRLAHLALWGAGRLTATGLLLLAFCPHLTHLNLAWSKGSPSSQLPAHAAPPCSSAAAGGSPPAPPPLALAHLDLSQCQLAAPRLVSLRCTGSTGLLAPGPPPRPLALLERGGGAAGQQPVPTRLLAAQAAAEAANADLLLRVMQRGGAALQLLDMGGCRAVLGVTGLGTLCGQWVQLRALSLAGCQGLSGESLAALVWLKNLQELDLTGCSLDDTALPALACLTSLTALHHPTRSVLGARPSGWDLPALEYFSALGTRWSDAGLSELVAGSARLAHLRLSGTALTDAGLRGLVPDGRQSAGCPLRHLELVRCSAITQHGIEPLCAVLETLAVSGSWMLTASVLADLARKSPSLQSVVLDNAQLMPKSSQPRSFSPQTTGGAEDTRLSVITKSKLLSTVGNGTRRAQYPSSKTSRHQEMVCDERVQYNRQELLRVRYAASRKRGDVLLSALAAVPEIAL